MKEDLLEQFERYMAGGGEGIPGLPAESLPARADPRDPALRQFHLFDEKGRAKGVFDWAVYQHLTGLQEMFVLGGVPYLYSGGCFRADQNGAGLKKLIRACCYPEFIKATTIRRVYDLFIGAEELQATFEEVNRYPAHWINFRNGFYDPIAHRMVPHDPRYRAVNQIPHAFDPEARPEGEAVEEWLRFITPDAGDREMLLEFAGYCMTRDVRQQKFLILSGEGGTGKSTVIRMIEAVIGRENLSNISLSELTQRFASYGLLGKLLNACADLEIAALEDTSTLKKILGEDTLRGEAKGRDAFSFRNYARLIFSTNELPVVRTEKSNGFFRRLLVLTMNRVPPVRRPDLFADLSARIDYWIRLCVDALERMYMRGNLLESGHSRRAVERLRMDSDTVEAFLNEKTVKDPGSRTERGELYGAYKQYCLVSDRQALTRNNFYRSMRVKGIQEVRLSNGLYFRDISYGKTITQTITENVTETDLNRADEDLPFMRD